MSKVEKALFFIFVSSCAEIVFGDPQREKFTKLGPNFFFFTENIVYIWYAAAAV
jgi:hypothetical protein